MTEELGQLRKQFRKDLKTCAKRCAEDPQGDADAKLQELHGFFETNNRGVPKFDVDAFLAGFSSKELEAFWKDVSEVVKAVVNQENFLDALEEHSMVQQQQQDESEETDVIVADLKLLRNFCSILQAFLNKSESSTAHVNKNSLVPLSEKFIEIVTTLHDQLFYLAGPEGSLLQNAILRICSTVWKQRRVGRENVILHTVPALLVLSLEENAKNADVKRVYEMKDALDLFDLEDESSDGLRELMLRCFISPLYLRTQENRKVLEQFLLLSEGFVEDIHQAVKNQIPYSTKAYINAYQDLYFKAWSRAEPQIKQRIEESCIQDLMARGVNCKKQGTFNAVRTFLWNFTQQKTHKGVSELVSRLYSPILWRALEAPNAKVRLNATLLFLDAFPLGNVKASPDEFDETMQTQIDFLSALLFDRSADIRKHAVHGVCKVVSIFWEILPTQTIKTWLKQLTTESAHDSNSPNVRQAVFEGFAYLLDQACTHDTMKQLLSTLWKSIHDKNDKVRIEFIKVLQRVQSIKGMHFYEIVPTKELMARLAMDAENQQVCYQLVKLLHPSFYPEDAGGAELINRVIQSLTDYPAATLVLYKNLHRHIPVPSVTKLILLIHKAIGKAVEKEGARKRQRNDASPLHVSNVMLMKGFVQSIVALWENITSELQSGENSEVKEKLHTAFTSDVLSEWISVFQGVDKSGEINNCLIKISGFLPEENAEQIASVVREQIAGMALDEKGHFAGDLLPLAEALSCWGSENDFLQSCITETDMFLSSTTGKGPKRKKGRGKGEREVDVASMWYAVEHMLNYNPNFLVTSECGTIVQSMHNVVIQCLRHIEDIDATESSKPLITVGTVVRVFCQCLLRYSYSTSDVGEDNGSRVLNTEARTMCAELAAWFDSTGLYSLAKCGSAISDAKASVADRRRRKALNETMGTLLSFFSDCTSFDIPTEQWVDNFFKAVADFDMAELLQPIPTWEHLESNEEMGGGNSCVPAFASHLLQLVAHLVSSVTLDRLESCMDEFASVCIAVVSSPCLEKHGYKNVTRWIRKQLFRSRLGRSTWKLLLQDENLDIVKEFAREAVVVCQESDQDTAIDMVDVILDAVSRSEHNDNRSAIIAEVSGCISKSSALYNRFARRLSSYRSGQEATNTSGAPQAVTVGA
eukprot:gb/GECG01006073.1/.p1 GENE.gb/GECG01006073.1/~~gb/GECG01006073.1/.p1  ORF type:complete len:1151 (+),score=160.32 gb/GECG01006073.1/:1-3453(+)